MLECPADLNATGPAQKAVIVLVRNLTCFIGLQSRHAVLMREVPNPGSVPYPVVSVGNGSCFELHRLLALHFSHMLPSNSSSAIVGITDGAMAEAAKKLEELTSQPLETGLPEQPWNRQPTNYTLYAIDKHLRYNPSYRQASRSPASPSATTQQTLSHQRATLPYLACLMTCLQLSS